jgi:hypothetical protein
VEILQLPRWSPFWMAALLQISSSCPASSQPPVKN